MSVSNEFLDYVKDLFFEWEDVSTRKMFGGAGLYCDGKMFGLIADDVVYFKVDQKTKQKYVDAGSFSLQPFPDKPALTSYYEIPPDILENNQELLVWAQEALNAQTKRSKPIIK
jgi:DNA transformation protein